MPYPSRLRALLRAFAWESTEREKDVQGLHELVERFLTQEEEK